MISDTFLPDRANFVYLLQLILEDPQNRSIANIDILKNKNL